MVPPNLRRPAGLRTLRHRLPPFRCHRDRHAGLSFSPVRSFRHFARCPVARTLRRHFCRINTPPGWYFATCQRRPPRSVCGCKSARMQGESALRAVPGVRRPIGRTTMTTGNRLGVTRFATPSDRRDRRPRARRGAARAGLRRLDEAGARHAVDARAGGLHDAGVRDRSPRRRRLAFRLARARRSARSACAASTGRSRRPERLVSTEHWGEPWPETLNAFDFTEDDDGTLITCTVVYPTKAARDAALETGLKEGMNDSFTRLAAFLG